MSYEYFRQARGREELVAKGEQEIACLRRDADKLVPTPVPGSLRKALEAYQR